MKKLINIVNDPWTLEKLGNTEEKLKSLLEETGTDGFELLKTEEDTGMFPEGSIIGRHLYFYPMWMDFIIGRKEGILEDFGTFETAMMYYRAKDREGYISNLRDELEDAKAMGVEYVVMHVSHMSLREAYTYKYRYTSREIAEEFIKVINGATENYGDGPMLLLENNWYPGLDFLSGEIMEYLLENIRYPHTFFLLDTGHLVNTSVKIRNEEEALKYMEDKIQKNRRIKDKIKGVHLNLTFSGGYAESVMKNHRHDVNEPYEKKMTDAMEHIGKIDKHGIFTHNGISIFIRNINPRYLVYELSYGDRDDLISKIHLQDIYLDSVK